MADVTKAFLSGISAASAEQEHEQALADSKLRQQVLKHQLNSLKLEDTLRAREVTKQQADLGLGQEAPPPASATPDAAPAAAAPSTSSGLTAPASLGDAISGMARDRITGGATSPIAPAKPKPLPGDIPVPQGTDPKTFAQQRGVTDGYLVTDGQGQYYVRPRSTAADAAAQAHGVTPPSTAAPSGTPAVGRVVVPSDAASGVSPMVLHHEDAPLDTHTDFTGKGAPPTAGDQTKPPRRDAVWLPPMKVPQVGIDIPGMWYSPRAAADEQSRRAIALKRAEMPNQVVGPEDTLVEGGTGTALYTNPASRGNTPQEQYIAALKKGDTAGAKVILQGIKDTQRPGAAGSLDTMLLDARRKGDTASATLIAGVMRDAAGARRDPAVAADRQDQHAFANAMRLYSEDVANGWKTHGDAMKVYLNNPLNAVPETAQPTPEYTPPSFEDWRAQHGGAGAAAAKPAAGGKAETGREWFMRVSKGVTDQQELDRLYEISKGPESARTAAPSGGAGGKKAAAATPSTGKTVTEAELTAIATKKGTTVDVQRARYKAGGYTIAAPK